MLSVLLVASALLAADPMSAKPSLTVKVGRDNTQVHILKAEQGTVLDVVCPFGIDKATVQRTGDSWPQPLIVRLHLKGLESFRAGKVSWSVSSSGKSAVAYSVPDGETVHLGNNPYASAVRIVNSPEKIPLVAEGYFEITLPVQLFKDNPAELKLSWIDFYR